MTRLFASGVLATLLFGCAVGPDYEPPQTGVVALYSAEAASFSRAGVEAAWWRTFGDPVLDELIDRALASDLDVRIAAARVRASRALIREQSLDRWPAITADAGYDRRKAQQPGFTSTRIESETYEVGFDAAWELDLFGRVRRGLEAARAQSQAAQADLQAVQVSVAAEVARTYLEMRGAQRRQAVAIANRDNQSETVRITRVRYELGRGTELDLESANARLAATEASIPPLLAAEQVSVHRLAVLLGEQPATMHDMESLAASNEVSNSPLTVVPIAIGDPATLLRRRPDVRGAERELAVATARVGVATADLFPRLSLSGFVGFISGDADAVGDSASNAWNVTPNLSWAAFDLGSVRARLRAAEAEVDVQLAVYEQTVLRALEETENSLVTYTHTLARLEALRRQTTASQRAAELARIRYREGAIEFLRQLDAERTVLEAQDALAIAQTELNTAMVAIYKALGGGWEVAPPVAALANDTASTGSRRARDPGL
jgi:multidrug efflux system outer membrane protein